jgi:hypothetical protein
MKSGLEFDENGEHEGDGLREEKANLPSCLFWPSGPASALGSRQV